MVVGIPFPANFWVVQTLRAGGGGTPHDTARFNQSMLAYAAYEAIREKLSGSIVKAVKNKVVGSECGAQGDEFLISVTCAPTLATARDRATESPLGRALPSLRRLVQDPRGPP